ncbi:hypothetical protein HYH02_010083 [Chlamydomonas schloesseri]|uniref:Adhesin domain-containing protein n=1 Tax=Chlamydomonas schloesseri TaxID=2026947 RepID=A0A835TLV0_9CHLO|nr:hypothetical protein HYH02_010083 [Chlamydomonas schloesseri]|eukprot:KAG2441240.1 hypothetical protein HYH02_010083 [Chlamydomonas schloesseri]
MNAVPALTMAHTVLASTGPAAARVARLLPPHITGAGACGLRSLHDHSVPSAPATAGSAVPVIPGTLFKIEAGACEVQIQHIVGWSDSATLQGQPAGGSSAAGGHWRVTPVPVDSPAGAAATHLRRSEAAIGTTSDGASGSTEGFTGQPKVSRRYAIAAELGSRAGGGTGGVLRLSVPEKWISLDVTTQGCPLSVSRLVEADLRASTAGGPVRLGAIRGLDVRVDTTATAGASSSASAPGGGGGSGGGDGGGGGSGGSITGGEVSGTRVALAAGGAIDLRRLVGGVVDLRLAAAVRLGAVYGGAFRLQSHGGDVRIGTLDCGGHAGVPAGVLQSGGGAGTPGGSTGVNGSGGGSGSGRGGSGGAEVASGGGRVTVDGLEGYARLDSGGGDVKVLAGAGLRHAVIRTAGGALDCALDPGTALELVEVRQAGQLDLDPGLQPHLRSPGMLLTVAAQASGGTSDEVWCAAVAAEPVGGRGGIRGANAAAAVGAEPDTSYQGGGGGRLVIEAGGGAVRLRRLGWMEALKARMAERQTQAF